jgi:hypothetical protein
MGMVHFCCDDRRRKYIKHFIYFLWRCSEVGLRGGKTETPGPFGPGAANRWTWGISKFAR